MKLSIQSKNKKRRLLYDGTNDIFEKPSIITDARLEYHQLLDESELYDQNLVEEAIAFKEKACIFALEGDFHNSLKLLMAASFMDPGNYLVQDLLAQVYLNLGRWMDAVKSAERAIAIAPTWIEGYLTLARARREFGEVELSCDSYRHYLKSFPDDEEAKSEYNEMIIIFEKLSKKSEEGGNLLQASILNEEEREAARCFLNLSLRIAPVSQDT